ncbi:DUF1801 domain-containing protein [Massilia sp. G4R7]|uniref:DUF1801 domain-containing protein n=1 Tax=Massilia phyllostachyos TaxID=2898585 RepID=A0ABS8PZZ3_9BURK|nr:DUF1801 domain-containing protein [Massilia phyllostachyos]MCD2515059.1 DUF1801 domain-containing protein [Massilia phyllostachyos]
MASKTVPTDSSFEAYLEAIVDPVRRQDCAVLAAMMEGLAGAPAVMWGASIVGFGSYHYRYDSGREGDAPLLGFSSRKGDISVYLSCDDPPLAALREKLGRHKMGKACLYLRRLDDVDRQVLEAMLVHAADTARARYPQP